MILDLNNCFPEPPNPGSKRGPLPKQAEFLRASLDNSPTAPKYIRYVGGVGSGKSLIGCVTILSAAVMYPGDYMVCREFMPHLRRTTYKMFLQICPPELILEHRIADAEVKIKCAGGGYSTIYFVGIDEPDKYRSLTINMAFIDEGQEIGQEPFDLLQTRVRGPALRKIIMTQNSAGRGWAWRLWVDQSDFKDQRVKNLFFNIKAPSTENIHLPHDYVQNMLATYTDERIRREVYADEESFEGAVYPDFKRHTHVVKPFLIPDHWERHIRIDHGFRNPTAALFFAVNPEGEVFLYREFYEREWLIHEIINGKKINAQFYKGIHQLGGVGADKEKFVSAKIDPSTKNRSGVDGTSPFDEYYRHWPREWPMLGFAKNDVDVGIDRVKSYMKPHPVSGKPLFFVFDTCKNSIDELGMYRYPDLKPGQEGKKAENEKPVKVDDHACDATRYMLVDLPDPSAKIKPKQPMSAMTLENRIRSELSNIHTPKERDPFGDA